MKPDLDKLLSLSELLESRAAWLPESTFAIFPDMTITYRELLGQSSRLAKGLIADGLKPGGHVAILMPNCLHFLLAHFAVQLAGGKSVLLNARFKKHELAYVVAHCDASVFITTDCIDQHVNFTGLLSETFPELATAAAENIAISGAPLLRRIVLFGDKAWKAALPSKHLIELGRSVSDATLAKAHAGQDPEDIALMLYTSGTTATPKALRDFSCQSATELADLFEIRQSFRRRAGMGPHALLSLRRHRADDRHYGKGRNDHDDALLRTGTGCRTDRTISDPASLSRISHALGPGASIIPL